MKRVSFITAFCFVITCSCSQTPAAKLAEVYRGDTPCGDYAKQLLGIRVDLPCEKIYWNLTLYQDSISGKPARFTLKYNCGMTVQGTPHLANDSISGVFEGVWTIRRGTKAKSSAIVYELKRNGASMPMSFVKMGDNMLHLLYHDGSLMIGNGGWSYTLNSIRNNR